VRTVAHAYDMNNRRISRFVDEGLDFLAFGGAIENRNYFYYDREVVAKKPFAALKGKVGSNRA
jgi:hypothetical protein